MAELDLSTGPQAGSTKSVSADLVEYTSPVFNSFLSERITPQQIRRVKVRHALLAMVHGVMCLGGFVWAAVGKAGLTADVFTELYTESSAYNTPSIVDAGYISLPYFIAVAPAISFVHHLLYCQLSSEQIVANVSSGLHLYRWMDYSISAGVITISVAVMCGIRHIFVYIGIGGMNIGTMMCGFATEACPYGKPKIVFFSAGCLLQVMTWSIIYTMFGSALAVSDLVPSFVIVLNIVIICCYAAYAVEAYVEHIGPLRAVEKYSRLIGAETDTGVSFDAPTDQEAALVLDRRLKFDMLYDVLSLVTKACLLVIMIVGSNLRSGTIESP